MKHTKALLIFSTILTVTFGTVMPRTVQPVKDWTVLIFIEGRNNLNNFAKKNIREMLNVGSNKRLNILTQWYQPGRTKEAWRYKIERSKIVTCGTVPARSNGKSQHKKDLVDAMRWAVTTHPAKHYALVLWDHGLGIIDPKWKQGQLLWGTGASVVTTEEDEFEQDLDAVSCSLDNPRTQIDGITSCFSAEHRGILFNERDRTYMNNQDLVAALHTIKHDVLKGENIDLLGMDACLMGMIEIGYQIRKYADYFVGSQEVELAQGWNYGAFLSALASLDLVPHDAAQVVVKTYEQYYKPRTYLYTQSAIALANFEGLKVNLDSILSCIKECKGKDLQLTSKCVMFARQRCLEFSTPSFVDLHSFYEELSHQLDNSGADFYGELKEHLSIGMKLIKGLVIANTTGPYLKKAKGIAVYFPRKGIDKSYALTDFVKDTGWIDFVRNTQKGR